MLIGYVSIGLKVLMNYLAKKINFKMDVSKNRGTPKWMVKIMEIPINKWMIWGEKPTIFGNTQMFSPSQRKPKKPNRSIASNEKFPAASSKPCSLDVRDFFWGGEVQADGGCVACRFIEGYIHYDNLIFLYV